MARAAWVACYALIVGLALEVTCRIDDWVRFGTPFLSPVGSELGLLVRDSVGMHARPSSQYQKYAINRLGLRGPEVSADKAPGTIRIISVGASETFGMFESPRREYPRQLEDSLRQWVQHRQCGGSPGGGRGGPRFEVLNAAIFGMTLPTIEQDLRLRLASLHPNVVLVYPTPVQYLDNDVPRPAEPSAQPTGLEIGFRLRSTERLRERVTQAMPVWLRTRVLEHVIEDDARAHDPDWLFTHIPVDRLASYESDLRRLVGSVHRLGAVVILMTHANAFEAGQGTPAELAGWKRSYPRANGQVLVEFDSAAALVTAQVARDSGVALIDLASAVRHRGPGTTVFADYAHFTDLGAAYVAGLIRPAAVAATGVDTMCLSDHA